MECANVQEYLHACVTRKVKGNVKKSALDPSSRMIYVTLKMTMCVYHRGGWKLMV